MLIYFFEDSYFYIGLCSGFTILYLYRHFFKYRSYTTEKIKKVLVNNCDDYKMVFLIRTDLKLDKVKVFGACTHAVIGLYQLALKARPNILKLWLDGQAKITLKIDSETNLQNIKENSQKNQLPTYIIYNSESSKEPQSLVLAIGPGSIKEIDNVTRHLKLY